MKLHKLGATIGSAALLAGGLMGNSPVTSGNTAFHGASLPPTTMRATTQHLCLSEHSTKSSFQFGGAYSHICFQGYATMRTWQLSPRYAGSPILIELSAVRESSQTNSRAWPQADKKALNGKFRLDLKVSSGGHFATAPGGYGAMYWVSFGSMFGGYPSSAGGGKYNFSGPQFATQSLTAVAGLKISGSADRAVSLTPPIEPHPHMSHGSSGESQSIQVIEWIPPSNGGTLKWSYDGASGTTIHVGAAQPVPKGWKVSQAGSIATNPSLGASYAVSGVPQSQLAADLKATHAAGYVDFTPHGGANLNRTGQHALSLRGVISAWKNPKPGQSATAYADMNENFSSNGKWPVSASLSSLGNWAPTDGLTATMVKDVDGRLTIDTLTPNGTRQQVQTLRIAGGKGNTNKWVPVAVHATKNGKPMNGLAHLTVRSGPRGAKLQSSSVFLRAGKGTDAVMATTAGTVALAATLAGVHAVGVAHVVSPFPWWILLLIAAGALGYGGYRYQRERKARKN